MRGVHRVARRLVWLALSLALLSSLGWRAGLGAGGSSEAAQRKHRYEIMLTVAGDPSQTTDQAFHAAIKRAKSDAAKLNVNWSGKPWRDKEPCSKDPLFCDRVALNLETRQLLIACNGEPQTEMSAPICIAAERDRQAICSEKLFLDFTKMLLNHSIASHRGKDW